MSKLTRREFVTTGVKTAVGTGLAALGLGAKIAHGASTQMVWSGALTPTSIKVNARLSGGSSAVRLVVSESATLSNPTKSAAVTAAKEHDYIVGMAVSQLQPDTKYYYALEIDGSVDTATTGEFRTPPDNPFSFTFTASSCASETYDLETSDAVFKLLSEQDALFFLHLGDLHYRNIDKNDRSLFRKAIRATAGSDIQQQLYQKMPLAYIWDDHDYGDDNSDGTSPSREAARLTYQEFVPHYPLGVGGSGDVPIYQAFTIGRVRFVLTDLRSERTPSDAPQGPSKTMIGAKQLAWLKDQIQIASIKGEFLVWASSVSWIDKEREVDYDTWGCYYYQRKEIANFIQSLGMHERMMIICGDAHMLAADDGTNSNYSDDGGMGFPVFQTAALSNRGSEKGGPYSEGVFTGEGQFGVFEIVDTGGDSLTVNFSGRKLENELLSYSFTVSMPEVTLDQKLFIASVFR